jgi:serine/threonine-protein kinase
MGVVYKARQVGLRRVVALKVILAGGHASAHERARFKAEAEAVARLQHPNIVQIHEVGEHAGVPFFSLEYCGGGSLAAQLQGNPLPPHAAARLLATLARAVQAAHAARVIHRDLKPGNILLQRESSTKDTKKHEEKVISSGNLPTGETSSTLHSPSCPFVSFVDDSWIPKITDFGLAKQLDQTAAQTHSGAILGTPSYMAPEQAGGNSGEIGPGADIYALGAILYELLTGRPPFKAATPLDTLAQVLTLEPVPPSRLQPKVPRDVETVCLKCLAKDPAGRYPRAVELADDLERYLAGQPIQARRTGRVERLVKWARRKPAVAAVWALCLLGAVVAASGWVWLAQKRSATTAAVEAALVEAKQRHGEARAAGGDLLRWAGAVASMKEARALAGSDYCDNELRTQVEEALTAVETEDRQARLRAATADKHRRMLSQAEAVRLLLTERDYEAGARTFRPTAQKYAEAFRDWQIDVDNLRPEEAAAAIRAYPPEVARALAGALDQWVQVEWFLYWTEMEKDLYKGRLLSLLPLPGGPARPALGALVPKWRQRLTVAQLVDPDPLRNSLRDAVLRFDLARFKRIVKEADPTTLPADTLQIMSAILRASGELAQAVDLLRKAAPAHADDYWMHLLLAHYGSFLRPAPWEEVARHYTAAVALRPDQPAIMQYQAFALMNLDRREEALGIYHRLLRISPDDAVAHHTIGIILRDRGDLEKAIQHGRDAVRLRPDSANFQRHLGRSLEAHGDLSGAEQAYRAAVQADRQDAHAHWHLGVVWQEQGRLADAAKSFASAVQLKPNSSLFWLSRADVLRLLRKSNEAIKAYRQVVRLAPGQASARSHLGRMLSETGKLDEALPELREAVRLRPDLEEAHEALGTALEAKKALAEAVAAHREMLRRWPESAAARARLAAALHRLGDDQLRRKDWDGAAASLRESAGIKPDAAAFKAQGVAHSQKARWTDAAQALRQAVQLQANDAEAWRLLGWSCQQGGRPAQAVEAYRQAVKQGAKGPEVQHGLGRSLLHCEDIDGAVVALGEAVRLAPKDYGVLCDYATALRSKKLLPEAVAVSRQAIAVWEDGGPAYLILGQVLADQGALPEALTALQESMRKQRSFAACHHIALVFVRKGNVAEALGYLTDPVEPATTQTALSYAGLLVQAGKDGDYRTCCAAMLKRFRRTLDTDEAFQMARCLVQAPAAGTEPAEAVRLATRAVKARPTRGWYLNALALALYRAGQAGPAAQRAQESLKAAPGWHPPLNWLVLALAHQRLDQAEEARGWLEKVRQAGVPSGMNPQDVVYYQLLRREAEAACKGPAETK